MVPRLRGAGVGKKTIEARGPGGARAFFARAVNILISEASLPVFERGGEGFFGSRKPKPFWLRVS